MSGPRIQDVLDRIPEKWGKEIRCGEGWHPIICDLNEKLAELDPDYVVLQVKEKFGSARYYCSHRNDPDLEIQFRELIRKAERWSAITCEVCGGNGKLDTTSGYWMRTLCRKCKKKARESRTE